eukprot:gene417-494_t
MLQIQLASGSYPVLNEINGPINIEAGYNVTISSSGPAELVEILLEGALFLDCYSESQTMSTNIILNNITINGGASVGSSIVSAIGPLINLTLSNVIFHNCTGHSTLITISPLVKSTISSNLMINGGIFANNTELMNVVYIKDSSVVIDNCLFDNNSLRLALVDSTGSTVVLSNTIMSNNQLEMDLIVDQQDTTPGIQHQSQLSITNCLIKNNTGHLDASYAVNSVGSILWINNTIFLDNENLYIHLSGSDTVMGNINITDNTRSDTPFIQCLGNGTLSMTDIHQTGGRPILDCSDPTCSLSGDLDYLEVSLATTKPNDW